MKRASRIDLGVAACAAAFVLALGIAAWWDPRIRVLHAFESAPYLGAAVLALRRAKLGYALGVVSGGFWLWTAGCLTTFIRNGFERLALLMHTGSVDRPDILLAVPAAMAASGLVVCSGASYTVLPSKSWRDVVVLIGVAVLVPAFFVAIFAAFAPEYLGMFSGILRGH